MYISKAWDPLNILKNLLYEFGAFNQAYSSREALFDDTRFIFKAIIFAFEALYDCIREDESSSTKQTFSRMGLSLDAWWSLSSAYPIGFLGIANIDIISLLNLS
jgi:hypothetical protein